MTVQLLKQSLHDLIDKIDDLELLAAYYKVLSTGHSTWWEEITEAEKDAIRAGLSDLEQGEIFSHEAVMKEVRELLDPAK